MRTPANDFLPPDALAALEQAAQQITLARKRRQLRQADVASSAQISLNTYRKIEGADPSYQVGALLSVLSSLGLAHTFRAIADPAQDPQADARLAVAAAPKRIRGVRHRVTDNDF